MDDKKQIEELIKACGKLAGSLDFTISVLQKLASEDCELAKAALAALYEEPKKVG